MLSTVQLRHAWAPACAIPTRSVEIVQGVRIQCHERAATAMQALGRVLEAHAYPVRPGDTGAFVCRPITGGQGHSLHAYGIAIDINWNTNPYRADNVLVTDMPRVMVKNVLRIRTVSGERVFRWGGDYTSVKDAMHFEIVCPPADLATGIDWSTVHQPPLDEDRPHRWPLIRLGDRGPAVEELHRRLRIAEPGQDGFGHFGPRTEAAVRDYQAAHGLEIDGRVGRQTWTALLTEQPEVPPGEAGPVKRQVTGHPVAPPPVAEIELPA
ncbi:MAG TPA: peptidoglycan-binding protein [Longimicrobiales bacterium]|nr:peptidoglycan-binding protein [Longimicrobiales bacterium]